ncbi:MAG: cysteine desulfurase [Deltaproteobacteria bacterium]|nr:cysteine desulfurase [Deltaproteobacteria bacterium]
MRQVYLDNNATTRPDPDVIDAMLPFMHEIYGNPSSIHRPGQMARRAMDDARETVAEHLDADPKELIFTAGGSEANNLAILGLARSRRDKGRHVITTAIEHPSVLEAFDTLRREGFDLTIVPVNSSGVVEAAAVREAVTDGTILVSMMYANNEIGTFQPIEAVAQICDEIGIPFHVDAVQAGGRTHLDVDQLGVDLLTLSAHKFHGPKGVGLLFARKGIELEPLIRGGHHERARRAGTENVPSIVGFAKAMDLAEKRRDADVAHMRWLRDYFEGELVARIKDVRVTAQDRPRLPNTSHVCFKNLETESILLNLDLADIAASAGSACSSGSLSRSHVLDAMGMDDEYAMGAVRFSLSRETTAQEIDATLDTLEETVRRLRSV